MTNLPPVCVSAELWAALMGASSPADVVLSDGGLPPDLPVVLPAALQADIIGGVRTPAPVWTFAYEDTDQIVSSPGHRWQVLIRLSPSRPQLLSDLQGSLEVQGFGLEKTGTYLLWGVWQDPPQSVEVLLPREAGFLFLRVSDIQPQAAWAQRPGDAG